MDRLSLVLALLLASATALAQPESAQSLYQQAVSAEQYGNSREAVRLYVQAARGGHGKSAYRLGEIYDKGISGVERDQQESVKWFNAARVLGYPPLVGDFPPGFTPNPPIPPAPTSR